jgi:hypothetical protein
VSDGNIISYDRRVGIARNVNYGPILNIRMMPDANVINVAANYAIEPDAGMFADFNVADDLRALVNVDR